MIPALTCLLGSAVVVGTLPRQREVRETRNLWPGSCLAFRRASGGICIPATIVWGEPPYGLHATLLRLPATSWERESKTRTTTRCPVQRNRPPSWRPKTVLAGIFSNVKHRN